MALVLFDTNYAVARNVFFFIQRGHVKIHPPRLTKILSMFDYIPLFFNIKTYLDR